MLSLIVNKSSVVLCTAASQPGVQLRGCWPEDDPHCLPPSTVAESSPVVQSALAAAQRTRVSLWLWGSWGNRITHPNAVSN